MKLIVFLIISLPMMVAASNKISLSGSSTVAPLILEMAKLYEKQNPKVRVDVQTGGSSRGVLDTRKGMVDLGMASRDLKDSEKDLVAHTVAVDGVAPIVNSGNSIQRLSKLQMRDIFLGKIRNWKEVGGPDLSIVVINRAEGRSELELTAKTLGVQPREIKAHLISGENSHVVKSVASNRRAISYMSLGHAAREAQLGAKIKLLDFEGVAPTIRNVQTGQFPLARPLNLLTRGAPQGRVGEFLKFVQSKRVHSVIKEQSFVPIPR